jgi:hypothetical protein
MFHPRLAAHAHAIAQDDAASIRETETYFPLNEIVTDDCRRDLARRHDATADARLAGSMFFSHPWLRLRVVIRTMLSTRWRDRWPTVNGEFTEQKDS